MKIEPFTFVNRFSKDCPISKAVDEIRGKCKDICPEAKIPKLYNHTTIFPPFWAPPDEMKMFMAGISILDAQYGKVENRRTKVRVSGVDFFRNPGNNDAMVLHLIIAPWYRTRVQSVRKIMHGFSRWEFPLFGDEYNPHMCFVEGLGIYEKLSPHKDKFEAKVRGLTFHLSFPEIMIKTGEKPNTSWEKFDFEKQY